MFLLIMMILVKINVYVRDDEKIHFVDRTGADLVLPFNKGGGSYSVSARVRSHGGNYYTLFLEILVNGTLVSSKAVATSSNGNFLNHQDLPVILNNIK